MVNNGKEEFFNQQEGDKWLFFPRFYKNNPWVIKIIPLLEKTLERYHRGELPLGLLGKSFSSLSYILHQKVNYILSPPKTLEEKAVTEELEHEEEVEHMFPAIRVPGRRPMLIDFLSALVEMKTRDKGKYIERLKALEEHIKSTIGFNEQRVNIERFLSEVYEKIIALYKRDSQKISFKDIMLGQEKLEIIRTLLCLLYLELEGKISIFQTEDGEIFVKPI